MKEKSRPFSDQDIIEFMRDLTMESGRRFIPGSVLPQSGSEAEYDIKNQNKRPQTEKKNDPLELL